jgi:hypothetical protein
MVFPSKSVMDEVIIYDTNMLPELVKRDVGLEYIPKRAIRVQMYCLR